MVAEFDFNNITSLTANKCSYSYVVLVHLYLTVFKMQCWRSQADYKKPYLCSRLYKKENNELFGLGTTLQAGNVFRTKFTCSLKLVHFARLCAFHSRNINHHFPPLVFSGRVQSPRSTPPPALSPSHRGRLPVLRLSSFHSSEGAKSGPQSLRVYH